MDYDDTQNLDLHASTKHREDNIIFPAIPNAITSAEAKN